MLKPLESDELACFRRNAHKRTLADIQALAKQWEEPPPLYTQLDVASLFRAASGGCLLAAAPGTRNLSPVCGTMVWPAMQ